VWRPDCRGLSQSPARLSPSRGCEKSGWPVIFEKGVLNGFESAKKLAPKNNWAKKLAVLSVLFHPTFFYNSAYWGQIDAIPLFFVLVASYLLLFSSRYLTSAIIFIAAILVKPTALVFVLPYSVYFLWKFGWIKSVRAFLLAQAVFILSFLPYISNQNVIFYPYIAYLKKIMDMGL